MSGQLPLREIARRKLPPKIIAPKENCPLNNSSRTIAPQESCTWKITLWKIAPEENLPPPPPHLVHSFDWKPFLLLEVIVFTDFVVFKDHLIAISGYLYIEIHHVQIKYTKVAIFQRFNYLFFEYNHNRN